MIPVLCVLKKGVLCFVFIPVRSVFGYILLQLPAGPSIPCRCGSLSGNRFLIIHKPVLADAEGFSHVIYVHDILIVVEHMPTSF